MQSLHVTTCHYQLALSALSFAFQHGNLPICALYNPVDGGEKPIRGGGTGEDASRLKRSILCWEKEIFLDRMDDATGLL